MWIRFTRCVFGAWALLSAIIRPAAGDESPLSADTLQFFETRIRPVLVQSCYECHSVESKIVRGGLLLDSREGVRKGGDSGAAVVPGDLGKSLILDALKHETFQMPPSGRLPDSVVADFEAWIQSGAADPREASGAPRLKPVDAEAAARHWAFQIPNPPKPPSLSADDLKWCRNPIDQFILNQLRSNELDPSESADRRTLIRRATLDLTGLPPTKDEVDAFLNDDSPEAFAKVVDRLLASPHYGERWGRHWLDLVRYADTNGADENHEMPNAWRYRDWVIRMMNSDLPLDSFIVQQLAGDLLPVPEDETAAGDLLTATGMLVIGPKMLAEQDKDKMVIDIVDEQIDTVSRTLLGLTIGCARCHDHKFDPVSSRDYYSLAGIFYSTQTMANRDFVSRWNERPLPSRAVEDLRSQHQQKIDSARAELERMKGAGASEEQLKNQQSALEKLEKEMPAHTMVMAVAEGTPSGLPVYVRGNHLAPGPELLKRAAPGILCTVLPMTPVPEKSSGRLELARWLVSEQHPLTSRVMVNRIWMWHFGRPLMRSPSNFGMQSERPVHADLLDWLSRELIRRGWSMKEMHRLIMLSSTYQMTSRRSSEAAETKDPDNLLWRRRLPRRLEAEAVRDSLLFHGGELDRTMGGIADSTESKRRAVYLPINRAALYEMFSIFDYSETDQHLEQRPVTTVPQQALFVMNSPLAVQQAENLARRMAEWDHSETGQGTRESIDILFETLLSRPATVAEQDRVLSFLSEMQASLVSESDAGRRKEQSWKALCLAMFASNEFLYVE